MLLLPLQPTDAAHKSKPSSTKSSSSTTTSKLLQLNRIKQAEIRLTSMPADKLPFQRPVHKRRIYDPDPDPDDDPDEDFEPEKRRKVAGKRAKMTGKSGTKSGSKSAVKSARERQNDRGKRLVKKAIAQTTKVAKSGILTRRKRQEIEVKQFEQAKAASGYESSASDYIPPARERRSRHLATATEEKNDSEASSYTAKKNKKKKKKKKRRSEDDDDMIYLYMSFDEPESPEKRTKAPVNEETESRSSRRSRSRSASVATAVTDMTEERGVHEPSPKVKGRARASATASRPPSLRSTTTSFPSPSAPAQIINAPTFSPTPTEFNATDPLTYISGLRSRHGVERHGMCRVVPPAGWAPDCNVPSELRFTTQNQYIHKMMHRWGPNIKKMECIRKHLETQGYYMKEPPSVGRLEVDLPALSEAVEAAGGMRLIQDDKKKWNRIADTLNIPTRIRAADRTSKLYDTYCRYLLSYDTLTADEKDHIASHVDYVWSRQKHAVDTDCVTKGQSRSLAEFFRIASNLQAMFFGEEEQQLTREQVEEKYWELLSRRDKHVCVQYAHVDTENCGSAFPHRTTDPLAKHGWNFHQLQQNSGSVLKPLGAVNGVTIPELHIGMLFSTNCWACDPHALPYITYLHTGADIIWYCVPKSEESKLKAVLEELNPDLVDPDSPVWLSIDSIMVSPSILRDHGVSVSVTVQRAGEFVLVFPHAYTASLCCGYNIAESIRYAPLDWIPLGYKMAEILYESCEGELFSMERLLLKLVCNDKTPIHTLSVCLPCLEPIIANELRLRRKLRDLGLTQRERMQCAVRGAGASKAGGAAAAIPQYDDSAAEDEDNRCDVSKKICYLSMVVNVVEREVYSLEHAIEHVQKKKNLRACKLLYRYQESELQLILDRVRNKVALSPPPKKKAKGKH